LLREQSSSPEEDVQSFVDAIAFNWLIAGTDVHAKNYALLLGGSGAVRLAPLYDLVSILPYQTISLQKAKLATKASEIVAVRPSLGLDNANPSVAALKHSIAGTDNSPCLKHYRKTIPALRRSANQSQPTVLLRIWPVRCASCAAELGLGFFRCCDLGAAAIKK
jgi:HipA-like C-terminal domain